VIFVCILVFNIIDHSGVRLYSRWPWQGPTMFHDDHHVHFHVNFGQHLAFWDRFHGTLRRTGRRYGVDVFGGKGEPDDGVTRTTQSCATSEDDDGAMIASSPLGPRAAPAVAGVHEPAREVGGAAVVPDRGVPVHHAGVAGVRARVAAGRERRMHVLVWFAALIAGTANDLIFMALPLVDNFWQAQATIMITPRLPLYIPCVYVCFMYFPTVSVWRLGCRRWPARR
jgi:hypothetical protein